MLMRHRFRKSRIFLDFKAKMKLFLKNFLIFLKVQMMAAFVILF